MLLVFNQRLKHNNTNNNNNKIIIIIISGRRRRRRKMQLAPLFSLEATLCLQAACWWRLPRGRSPKNTQQPFMRRSGLSLSTGPLLTKIFHSNKDFALRTSRQRAALSATSQQRERWFWNKTGAFYWKENQTAPRRRFYWQQQQQQQLHTWKSAPAPSAPSVNLAPPPPDSTFTCRSRRIQMAPCLQWSISKHTDLWRCSNLYKVSAKCEIIKLNTSQ